MVEPHLRHVLSFRSWRHGDAGLELAPAAGSTASSASSSAASAAASRPGRRRRARSRSPRRPRRRYPGMDALEPGPGGCEADHAEVGDEHRRAERAVAAALAAAARAGAEADRGRERPRLVGGVVEDDARHQPRDVGERQAAGEATTRPPASTRLTLVEPSGPDLGRPQELQRHRLPLGHVERVEVLDEAGRAAGEVVAEALGEGRAGRDGAADEHRRARRTGRARGGRRRARAACRARPRRRRRRAPRGRGRTSSRQRCSRQGR